MRLTRFLPAKPQARDGTVIVSRDVVVAAVDHYYYTLSRYVDGIMALAVMHELPRPLSKSSTRF